MDDKPSIFLSLIKNGVLYIGLISILPVIYSVIWYVIAVNIKHQIKPWTEKQVGYGVQASFNDIEISGYPFSFQIILTRPRLFFPNAGAGWWWDASRVIGEMKPWNFNAFRVDLSGTHNMIIDLGGAREKYRATAQKCIVDV